LDILFASKTLEGLCHDEKLATRTLGALSARKLRTRLDDLVAAANLDQLRQLPGHFHGLTGARARQYALHLHGGHRLVIEPADNPLPLRGDGSLDLSHVVTLRVLLIGNYHE
jgi:proteic killer suppression protein